MQILVWELADAGVLTIKKYKINVYLGEEKSDDARQTEEPSSPAFMVSKLRLTCRHGLAKRFPGI